MQYNFQGKTALVTGAGQGIGEALAKRLGKEGIRVAVTDVLEERAKNVSDQIPGSIYLPLDVTSLTDCEKAARITAQEFGKIDYLVSNAGILKSGSIEEMETEAWQQVIMVNLTGMFHICKAVVPYMKKNGCGSIVQINSKSGKKGSYKNFAYAASKFGGIGLVQSLALELAEDKIRVNAVCPGNLMESPLWQNSLKSQYAKNRGITEDELWDIYSKQVPLGRTCLYKDVENAVMFLLADESEYLTGQALNVTGGFEMR